MNAGGQRGRPRGDWPSNGLVTLLLILGVFTGAFWIADHFVDVSPLAEVAETAEPALSWIGVVFAIVVIVLAVFVYPVYLRRS